MIPFLQRVKSKRLLIQYCRGISASHVLEKGNKRTEFSVDRSGLLGAKDALGSLEESKQALFLAEQGLNIDKKGDEDWIFDDVRPEEPIPANKEEMTELAKDLQAYIAVRGPISIHDFMLQGSNHLIHGYYQTSAAKIGHEGDFITAPEISQLFGEMLGMWCISQWMSLGQPSTIDLLELGPGKGTLMKDILRVASKFPDFQAALRVHMVELSEAMRSLQREAVGFPISWYYSLPQVAELPEVPSLVIAQEFLDAFPVHQFEYRGGTWKERLVDICRDVSTKEHFRFVLSPAATPAVKALVEGAASDSGDTLHSDGDTLEIAPLALATCETIANRICRGGGAALLVDYGENHTQGDTLRGFSNHKQVNALSIPGVADITADVDFAACARAAAKRGATAIGAVPQGEFLVRMGIVERVQALISQPSVNDEKAVQILASLKQLIDGNDMGSRFKVLGIYDTRMQINAVGFPSAAV
eukprot:GSChrysophyteH1.ASY1.ANO1.336.1 assembled CDS